MRPLRARTRSADTLAGPRRDIAPVGLHEGIAGPAADSRDANGPASAARPSESLPSHWATGARERCCWASFVGVVVTTRPKQKSRAREDCSRRPAQPVTYTAPQAPSAKGSTPHFSDADIVQHTSRVHKREHPKSFSCVSGLRLSCVFSCDVARPLMPRETARCKHDGEPAKLAVVLDGRRHPRFSEVADAPLVFPSSHHRRRSKFRPASLGGISCSASAPVISSGVTPSVAARAATGSAGSSTRRFV